MVATQCREVVTLNQTMHRSYSPPLTGLLNFPIIEHFKDSEIWGHGGDGEEHQADMAKLAAYLVGSDIVLGIRKSCLRCCHTHCLTLFIFFGAVLCVSTRGFDGECLLLI